MKNSFDVSKTALLVIDMQNDFVLPTGAIPVKDIQKGIVRYKDFLKKCRSAGMKIIFTRHTFTPEMNPIEAELFPELREGGLREETFGHAIVEDLTPMNDEIVLNKHKYNAFYDTKLDAVLKEAGMTSVIITGTMTEVCCETTARGAMERDYVVLFVSDLTFTSDPQRQKATESVIASHVGWVVSADEVSQKLV